MKTSYYTIVLLMCARVLLSAQGLRLREGVGVSLQTEITANFFSILFLNAQV